MRFSLIAAASLVLVSCTSPEPSIPGPLLAERGADVPLGLRELTDAQKGTLREAIVAAGRQCGEVRHTYLQAVDPTSLDEAWSVECVLTSYAIELYADGQTPSVVSCASLEMSRQPCFDTLRLLPTGFGRRSPRLENRLDPRLKELLEEVD